MNNNKKIDRQKNIFQIVLKNEKGSLELDTKKRNRNILLKIMNAH